MAHRIKPDERKHQDYLRRKGLKVGHVYEARLLRLRAHEVKRVLNLCLDVQNPAQWSGVIENNLDETGYLPKWFEGLFADAGLPMCKSTVQDLNKAKAATGNDTYWLAQLRAYAANRAGSNIVIVSGTLRESLINLLRDEMGAEPGVGIEKLAKRIYSQYQDLAKWQVRRIAQTESMVAMADAANVAAKTLGVSFTKQWCISGLGNTRDTHQVMDGKEVDQDEPFELEGGLLMYPHDSSMGAAASEIINCACCCIRRPKSASSSQQSNPSAPTSLPATAPASPYAPMVQTPATVEEAEKAKRIEELMKELPKDMPDGTKTALAENTIALEEEFGIKKGSPMSIEKADRQSANPDWSASERSHQVNCATCAPAYALRERGFDITAKGNVAGSGSLNEKASRNPWACWKNADGTEARPSTFQDWMATKKYEQMSSKRYQEFFDEVCKEQGTYELVLRWKGGGGHATIVKRLKDGSLVGIEPQKYWEWKGQTFKMDFTIGSMSAKPDFRCGVMRLNDKLLDPKWSGLFNVKK